MSGSIVSFDITNPAAPARLDYKHTNDDGRCIALKDNFAVVGTYGGLYFFDITNPSAMLPAGTDARWGSVSDIAVSGDYGYLALGHELHIVRLEGTCCNVPGDANHSGNVNVMDVSYVINFLYKSGPQPPCEAGSGRFPEADANGNGIVGVLDVTYLVNFLYKSGLVPICGPI